MPSSSDNVPPQQTGETTAQTGTISDILPMYNPALFWRTILVPSVTVLMLVGILPACGAVAAYFLIPYPVSCAFFPQRNGSACNFTVKDTPMLVFCGNNTPIRDGLACDIPIPYRAQFVNRQTTQRSPDTLATWNYISHRAGLIQYIEAYQAVLPKTGWRCFASHERDDSPDSPDTGVVTAFSPAAGGKPGGRNLRIDFLEGTSITLAIEVDTSPLASCGRAIG